MYELEVPLNPPEIEKPSRVEPPFVNDRVNDDPAAIAIEWEFPSAEKVLGEG